ncbi:MAG: hypothetical protein JW896_03105 [Deltaproteobacteria bacterium]|nr:hypothetical protein [Deltaproteobacteria bacterium]
MMDWLLVWQVFKILLAFGSILLTIITIIGIWRLRGVLHWRHFLQNELKDLNKEAVTANKARRRALELVKDRCQKACRASSPELGELLEISSFVRSIAGCYHKGAEKPEWKISVGRFIHAAQELVHQLELILSRPGFRRLGRVRIRHIRQSFEWYEHARKNRIVQYLRRNMNLIKKALRIRFVILPDPFSWLAYLSNRLTVITLTRCLLVDIYLFVGKMAVDAYDDENQRDTPVAGMGELEKTLDDLDSLENLESDISDPQIRRIRDRLVGFPSLVTSSPGLKEWKEALVQTACIVAKRHFPESVRPLEEAALGPLLARSRVWIKSLCEADAFPIFNRLYMVRIESLYNMKSFADTLLPKKFRSLMKKGWEMYGWMKWPLKGYRWIKRGSPAGAAMGVGWVLAKRGVINLVYRRTYDMAYKELKIVYRQSRSSPLSQESGSMTGGIAVIRGEENI